MIPELGHFALILAFLAALVQAALPLFGLQLGRSQWVALARPATRVSFVFMSVSFFALALCFYQNDFSVAYVAQNSNTLLPLAYRLSAVWGGHEGSLLLWVWLLAAWACAVTFFSRTLDEATVARVLSVLGWVNSGLALFVLLTSNPFLRLLPAAQEGRDLNPLLQDPGLVFHPPMLYMGYVGFAVAFAFALAALWAGRLDAAWARWSRPWTLVAWMFLTLGIALGSWWAYYELGWGGWWFWDPVENASLMPWLVGTALLHSLAVTEKRGAFRNWTVLLAIAAFSLSLLGTFLVRSGVLTSVHAFASDPRRGVFILVLLAIVVGVSLFLFAWRAATVRSGGNFALFSRETLLLCGNILLVCAAAAVALGTLYPLILDALDLGKISVGPPYFNAVFVPIMAGALVLLAFTPWARWKRAQWGMMARRLWPAVCALPLGYGVPWLIMGAPSELTVLGLTLAFWIAINCLLQAIWRMRAGGRPTLSWWGMQTAHMGIAIFCIGVTLVGAYQEERDVRMAPGDTVHVGGYTFVFRGVHQKTGPNYEAAQGTFEVTRAGNTLRLLPEKRNYFSSAMPMTETAIHSRLTRDLYVSLGEPLADGAWAVRVYYKPFVLWIWGGCLFMALGALLALADRRYRLTAS